MSFIKKLTHSIIYLKLGKWTKGKGTGFINSMKEGIRKKNSKFLWKIYLSNTSTWLRQNLRNICDIKPAFIKASRFCRPISGNKRLNVKLRHLLTQDSYGMAEMNCIISLTAIGRVVKEIIKCSIQHVDFNRVS